MSPGATSSGVRTSHQTDLSTHLHPAQPVSVPMPPISLLETSYYFEVCYYVATTFETEMHIANAGR